MYSYLKRIQALGLKQIHLAELVGVSQSHFNHFLHDRRSLKREQMETLETILKQYELGR